MSDYITDTKSVLDQCLRVTQAMLDFCADQGWLSASLHIVHLMQMCCQSRWLSDSDLCTLPHVEPEHLVRFFNNTPRIDCLPRLLDYCQKKGGAEKVVNELIGDMMDRNQVRDICQMINHLPQIEAKLSVSGRAVPDKRASKKTAVVSGKKGPSSQEESEASVVLKISTSGEEVYELYEDEEYVLNVDLFRLNKGGRTGGGKGREVKAFTPKYPKPKDENWVVVLGNDTDLVGLKRLSAIKTQQQMHILFRTPELEKEQPGDEEAADDLDMTLFFMSDVYLGLDQQYELKFRLKRK
jgi:hypothetical protein